MTRTEGRYMFTALPGRSLDIWCPCCGSDATVSTNCGSRNGPFYLCPDCGHEWSFTGAEEELAPASAEGFIRDESGRRHCLQIASADCRISCWVDRNGRVYTDADNDRDHCHKIRYELDLELRHLVRMSRSEPLLAQDWSARIFLDQWAGTAEKLIRLARRGVFDKMSLARLLRPDARQAFLRACAVVEKALTEACTARGDPCFAEGCAVEGEICLEACLAAGARYRDGCAAAWIDLFENPENRVDAWRR